LNIRSAAKRPLWQLAAVIIAVIVIALACHERFLSEGDPANLALAVRYGMDLGQERPHAPGYPFFVLVWRFMSTLTGASIHETMLVVNLAFAVGAIMLLWKLVQRLFDERIAATACAVLALNPLFLYYACVSEIYIYDAFISALTFLLDFRTSEKRRYAGWFLIGILGGFRISSVILMTPVLLIAQQIEFGKEQIVPRTLRSVAMVVLGSAIWAIPFLLTVPLGDSLHDLFLTTTAHRASLLQNGATFATYLFWTLNVWIVFIFCNIHRSWPIAKSRRSVALLLWIVAPSLFFIFVHYAKGYALLIWPAIAVLLANAARTSERRIWKLFPAIAIISGLVLFFYVPYIEPTFDIRTSGDHTFSRSIKNIEARALSHFLLALSRIERKDIDFEDCSNLIKSVPATHRMLIIDGASNTWLFPKAFAFAFPEDTLIAKNEASDGTVKFYHGATTIDQYPVASLDATNALLLWQDTQHPQILPAGVGAKLGQISYFGVYEFKDRLALKNEIQSLSFHESR
jgi:hypothetical protein